MKKLISKHYRKVFARDPKAFMEWSEDMFSNEALAKIITGDPSDGDFERFLLECHLSLHKAYGPVRAAKIEKQFFKTIVTMWN